MSAIRTKLLDACKKAFTLLDTYWQGDYAGRPLADKLRDVIAEAEAPRTPEQQKFFEKARWMQRDGELEIDKDAVVSLRDDGETIRGAYVQAWIWVDGDAEAECVNCAKCGQAIEIGSHIEDVDFKGKLWVYCSRSCRDMH